MNKFLVFISIAFLLSCSHDAYRTANNKYKKQVKTLSSQLKAQPPGYVPDSASRWIGTTNFDLRKPNFVIIHHTAQNSCEQTIRAFTMESSKVSAHYVICKDGTVHHMLNDYLRAWQAGVSKWGNNTDINSSSIGIELDNNGFEDFTEPQISSLLLLLDTLKKKYNIPTGNFIGHGDIAPTRKSDPNWRFPWKLLADKGFGNWYNDTSLVIVPPEFDHMQALRIIGYDMKDTLAVFSAFKRHWLQDTISNTLTPESLKILYDVSKKYE